MNKSFFLICAFMILGACSSDNDDMDNNGFDTNGMMTEETVSPKGDFVSDTHPTSGMVTVNDDQSLLKLTNFKTDDGPKLNLYLSTEVDSKEYIDLGDLKGLEGDFEYDIPAGTDLETYRYVVVWCVDFSVSFGHAELN